MALVTNRTAVIPKLEECGADGVEAAFDALFDPTPFRDLPLISIGAFDFVRACDGDVVFIGTGSFPGNVPETVEYGGLSMPGYSTLDLPAPWEEEGDGVDAGEMRGWTDGSEGGPVTAASALKSEPYASYFAPGTPKNVMRYMVDPLLLDKVKARTERCVVLGRNFFSLNWARAEGAFKEVVSQLTPHPSVRTEVAKFLEHNDLEGKAPRRRGGAGRAAGKVVDSLSSSSSPGGSGRRFLGIHLRMGDFLTDSGHISFGAACNRDPDVLVKHVKEMMEEHEAEAIVLATDDYDVPCARRLRSEFGNDALVMLRDASVFLGTSCKAALFDQEVLGHARAFIGDGKSTFSMAIHQIRTVKQGMDPKSTKWLG